MEQIKILHINDLHSHFEKFPKIERFFKSHAEGTTLAFDIGDNVDRSHPWTEATLGQANIKLLNRLNLTGATIGNNEGLSLEHDSLDHLYDEANFPIILSNIKDNGQEPEWAIEKMIVETESGLKIGVLGLTYPYPLAYIPFGWDIEDPLESLDRVLPTLDCDFTILLSHLGVRYDEKIANEYDIDLILGAHTHHVFEVGVEKNGTLLAAAGCYGEYIGEITLEFDEQKRLISSDIHAVPTNSLPTEKPDLTTINSWKIRGEKLLAEKDHISFGHALTNTAPNFEASNLLARIFCDYADVPAAILNSGLIVYDFPQEISPQELLEILPHSMRLVRYKVSGKELKEILPEVTNVASLLKTQQIHGMGFRGKYFGDLILYGMSYQVYNYKEEFLYQGQEIEDEKEYEFVVPDQYYFAKYFPSLKNSGEAEILFPKFLREIVYNYLKGNHG
ncbi:bifunctional metallophosphatase/5'-nucleotidase [Floricoccus penangensis]|uniref:bifunctional metallophosphatase/5'-nucleotidase n=1 Tax=Floricoccus penangensis TaxID=1859475 RepID=UPI0020401486|nr:bifunctional UDP-sugar hydrolase/5'-nucleotidase [Floricoccus penangensis]URZ87830.1 bifunctional metallophosphatase/5'-nucleotidase [Floricoccus penangensis]